MRLAPTLLRLWLASAPPEIRVEGGVFDPTVVQAGLLARVDSADDWVITARPSPEPTGEAPLDTAPREGCVTGADAGGARGGTAPPARAQGEPCPKAPAPALSVDVSLRRPDGSLLLRRLTLEAADMAGRSRELASLLAVLLEGGLVGDAVPGDETGGGASSGEATGAARPLPPTPAEGVTAPTPPARSPASPMDLYSFGPIRWGSADARFSVGDAGLAGGRVVDGGLGLSVGGRVLRDRLLFRGALGWARSQRSTLAVDGLRVGAGIGVGASLWRRRIWLGGEISPQFLVVRVTDVLVSTVASSSVEMGFYGQIGYQRFMVQLRSGADLVLPPVEGLGREDAISWGGVRFFATLGVGVRF